MSSNPTVNEGDSQMTLSDPSLYINRELSLLAFHARVLALAQDASVPLLERLRFLFICHHNLDEFFEIRVAALKQQQSFDGHDKGLDGRTIPMVLEKIHTIVEDMVAQQYAVLHQALLPQLAAEHIYFVEPVDWTDEQHAWIKHYFRQEILPLLTPIGLDLSHPFPRLVNKNLNFIVRLEGKDAFGRDSGLAIIHAPRILPRIIRLPKSGEDRADHFVFLSAIIQAYADELFPGMTVTGCYTFRLTRNAELFLGEESTDDLLHALKGKLYLRRYGDVVRLEVDDHCPPELATFLLNKFKMGDKFLYRVPAPVNLNRLYAVLELLDRPDLEYPAFSGGYSELFKINTSIFEVIKKQDVLLHHPFQKFLPVEELIWQAANDPQVLAIKMTLYRTKSDSRIVDALVNAARASKEVTAVVELRARFDEEDNITLANRLQEAGALVVYGVMGYKTHAKMTLIVRKEADKIARYAHLSTGNYHPVKATQYCDFSFFTCEQELTTDVHYVFQQLTGMGRATKLKKILHAPFTLHKQLLALIDNEIAQAKAGNPAHIMLKLNAITEVSLIQALYRASQAGVKIEIICRGICCLQPGVVGVSDNIQVRSIVGRFLEHARIYYFQNNTAPKLFLASADWMERNLFSRVEICFPIENPLLAERIKKEGLLTYLADNVQAWVLQSGGQYKRLTLSGKQVARSAQQQLLELYATGENG